MRPSRSNSCSAAAYRFAGRGSTTGGVWGRPVRVSHGLPKGGGMRLTTILVIVVIVLLILWVFGRGRRRL
jgi:uncharacterized membrane protein